ncbi:amidohydrolase [Halanaerobiaceae bacterium Z-7014]|uniref:Amidohydrolase n=1 Tax=Halonatronomonas betaini TaxID=2778430 RepID=A0A931ATA4_9FIRM|nr:amidohydrolase [Halonatronomonas betaini]MBF8438062.1 amidohydrolase [Halonatronomonas betaini]
MLAIKAGKIETMTEAGTLKDAVILIEDGRIKAIGEDVEIPEGAEVFDYGDKTILPGLIDAHTHLGIGEEGIGWEGRDYNETTNPVTPELRAIDAINPADLGLEDARKSGITSVMVAPGSANVIGGECLAMKTNGDYVDDMILKNPVGIKAAFGENPKRVYGEQKKSPSTRMAVAAEMRRVFMETEDYIKNKDNDENDSFKRDIKFESLARVINGEMPLKTHAHRADDIMTALRIADEFSIDLTIEHCTEGHKIAERLAEAGVPAIVGPSLTTRSKVEVKDRDFKTAAVLAEAGVKVALMSDHPVIPVDNLMVYAALAVKAGLERNEAYKSVTINPAEILGIDDRVGSLDSGKDADLVVYSGDPLDIAANVEAVYISGEKI